ncbi:REP element-mobilizing transposase RayT [Nostoc flagelliforme CCNUN1]|uniref:REP element-mobilizing transposase RayT n=1 Tax=Nostoc flagelliforme CCNUN1 TaxID=2038116 RepID=A0A2K8SZN0_9NOSO|nr:transposase [Nostoc flagelliforme]AUB40908.1 REP element-mobilizing transposase RayT [Nostoc flagelliforme CCNUN1]
MNNYDPQPKNNKPKYKGKYRIDSTRLPAWNYASDGGYFVTICTDGKKCFFGEVVQGEMQRSPIGEIAHKLWYEIPNHFSNCQIDSFCVMPNHIHGILIINQTQEDAMNRVSTRGDDQRGGVTGLFNPMLSKNSLSKIVRWYKGRCTFEINQIYEGFRWQGRFHDNIIRDEFALEQIRQYIINNPINWERDREQPPHSPL